MWESPKLLSPSGLCIAGDLVFIQDFRHRLVALDLYSGEELWSIADTKYAEGSVKVVEGLLLIAAFSGREFHAYTWDTIYQSPHKPAAMK